MLASRGNLGSRMLPEEVRLRFFSVRAAVCSDHAGVLSFCRELFGLFEEAESVPGYVLEILSIGPGSWRVRDPMLDAVIDEPAWLPGLVSSRLLETVGNEVEDHDLFHGAALSRGGAGLILAGESGLGKSTLTLRLLARGWRYLSDEVAALERKGGRLVPFPKAIEVRPGPALDLGSMESGPRRGDGKAVRRADELFPGCAGGPCTPAAVVFLEPSQPRIPPAAPGTLRLVVNRRVEGLAGALAEVRGIQEVAWEERPGELPVLAVRHAGCAAWRLDDVLGAHGVLILNSSAEPVAPADFDTEPGLEPISAHAGVDQLLRRFRGRRALERRMSASAGFVGLFTGLYERLRQARFYRLRVGRLEPTIEILERLVEGASDRHGAVRHEA